MESKKSNAGRKPLENRTEVKNVRFHFVFSAKQVEEIGGKSAVYELVKRVITNHMKYEN
jgi:hypothetical protein